MIEVFPNGRVAQRQLEGDDYVMLEDFLVYWPRKNRFIMVPKGFITDNGSIPDIIPDAMADNTGDAANAFVAHDWIYKLMTFDVQFECVPPEFYEEWSKRDADLLMRDIMVLAGEPRYKAWIAWTGVRLNVLAAWRWR